MAICAVLSPDKIQEAIVDLVYDVDTLKDQFTSLQTMYAQGQEEITTLRARVDDLEISAMTHAQMQEKEKTLEAKLNMLLDERAMNIQMRHTQRQMTMQMASMSQQIVLLLQRAQSSSTLFPQRPNRQQEVQDSDESTIDEQENHLLQSHPRGLRPLDLKMHRTRL